MTRRETGRRSERARAHDAMLETALARPGVREVMKVYRNWQHRDRGLDAWRKATEAGERVATTDRSNIR